MVVAQPGGLGRVAQAFLVFGGTESESTRQTEPERLNVEWNDGCTEVEEALFERERCLHAAARPRDQKRQRRMTDPLATYTARQKRRPCLKAPHDVRVEQQGDAVGQAGCDERLGGPVDEIRS